MFEATTRKRTPLWPFVAAGVLLLLVGGGALFGRDLWQIGTGQRTLTGHAKWEAPDVAPPLVYEGRDVREAMSSGVTQWSVATSRLGSEGPEAVQQAGEGVLEGLGPNTALGSSFRDLQAKLLDDPALGDGTLEALWAQSDAFNSQAEAAGAPLWLGPWAVNEMFYVKSYEVLAPAKVQVGEAHYSARFLKRIDTLAVREGRLGSVSDHETGATVLVDRVRDFVTRDVWAWLEPVEEDGSIGAVFAPEVRVSVKRAIGPEHAEALRRTAEPRRKVLSALDAIDERGRCSRLRVRARTWYGLAPSDTDELESMAREDLDKACPRATTAEVSQLREGFAQIVADDDAHAALQALYALAARAVLVHEARHVADDARHGLEEPEGLCLACPEGVEGTAAIEASAYLQSFADERAGVLAYYQACLLADGGRGAHARAVRAIAAEFDARGCRAGPPMDLTDQASKLHDQWFGATDPIEVLDVPESLPLH